MKNRCLNGKLQQELAEKNLTTNSFWTWKSASFEEENCKKDQPGQHFVDRFPGNLTLPVMPPDGEATFLKGGNDDFQGETASTQQFGGFSALPENAPCQFAPARLSPP